MTPVLVVDNTGRVICRGEIKGEGARATARLEFAEISSTSPARKRAAARTIAEINIEVRRRLEDADRRRRRQLILRIVLHGLRALAILAGLVLLAWAVVIALAIAIAAAFGFGL
jgi:hypothetical protein